MTSSARAGLQPVAHRSAAERAATGKAARSEVPRSSHGRWERAGGRVDPVEILQRQAATRVTELVPIRHGRMLASPFAFFRGGAAVMAADLAETPRSELEVQLCGDAHLSNFGGFAAPDRELVFDVNDFDETLPGPWEWDLKRLAASLEIAARERGFSDGERRRPLIAATREYRETIRGFAGMSNLETWYSRLDVARIRGAFAAGAPKKGLKALDRNIAKARTKDSIRALAKLTQRVDGELRIISDPPLITPIEELSGQEAGAEAGMVRDLLRTYRSSLPDERRLLLERYRYVHAARKVVGVGSVGTRAWIVLLVGRDDDDPLFLQVKEAEASVLEPYAAPSEYSHHGERVVQGQRLMQAAGDIFLGWLRAIGLDGASRDFYVRQLWDSKASAKVEQMSPEVFEAYARICGWTLARAHARSGDSVAIGAYVGGGDSLDRAIAEFAAAYADQNESDYAAVKAAVERGRLAAEEGK